MTEKTPITQLKGADNLPQKQEITDICLCDCVPCKTDSCERCELGKLDYGKYGNNGDLCREGNDSEAVMPFNEAIDQFSTIAVVLDEEEMFKILGDWKVSDFLGLRRKLARAIAQNPIRVVRLERIE